MTTLIDQPSAATVAADGLQQTGARGQLLVLAAQYDYLTSAQREVLTADALPHLGTVDGLDRVEEIATLWGGADGEAGDLFAWVPDDQRTGRGDAEEIDAAITARRDEARRLIGRALDADRDALALSRLDAAHELADTLPLPPTRRTRVDALAIGDVVIASDGSRSEVTHAGLDLLWLSGKTYRWIGFDGAEPRLLGVGSFYDVLITEATAVDQGAAVAS